MSASRLWSSGGLVSMLVLSLILLLCSICQASLATSSTVKYGRTGHFGGKLPNLKDSVCGPLITGDKMRCDNEATQKFPERNDEGYCKWHFYEATCLTPVACQKCPGDSKLIWIGDQQDLLDIDGKGRCSQWASLCPHLSCPTTPTPTVPNTTTPMATTEELITPKAPFPYWVIGVVMLVLLLLVGGFLSWKYVFKSSSSHKAKHSHGSSGPKRGATSSGLKKGTSSSGHTQSPKKPSSAHKKSTTGGHHQSSHPHQAAAKRGGHSSSTAAEHVPTKIGPRLVRPKTIKIKHIPEKNNLEVVKQQGNSTKSNELIILDFRKSIKWQ